MTTNSSDMHSRVDELPADLRSLDAALGSLAEADRAAAPADLEARVFAATREALIPASLPMAHSGQPLHARASSRFFTPMRLAAGLALAASLGAAILASRSGPATPTHPGAGPVIAQQPTLSPDSFDTLFTLAKGSDDAIGTEIDLIAAETDVFSSNLAPTSWSLDEGATSSM
jgi:hypothetical protein